MIQVKAASQSLFYDCAKLVSRGTRQAAQIEQDFLS